jgi:membrane protein
MTKMTLKAIFPLFKEAYFAWDEDKCWHLGAALSYFTIFSLGPVLIIIIAIAGVVFGKAAAQGQIVSEVQGLIGTNGAQAIQTMIQSAGNMKTTVGAAIFGFIMLIFGATNLFVQLRDALNSIWQIEEKPIGTVRAYFKAHIISFTLILGVAFVLLVSLIISAGLAAFDQFLSGLVPGLGVLLSVLDFLISFVVIGFVFALLFKYLPEAKIGWKDVIIGGGMTSLLFGIGKYLIGLYLRNTSVSSAFGAASSLVILMLWAFYSAQIMLYGAEFTKVYSNRFGSKFYPDPSACKLDVKKIDSENAK